MNNLLRKKTNELTKKKKKGFTLIELIIVIAIIAILAAIAIPKFGQVRTDANTRADQANAKNVAAAVAQALANGASDTEAVSTTDAKGYTHYIDGGNTINSKTTPANTLTPTIDGSHNIKVSDGTKQLYPIS